MSVYIRDDQFSFIFTQTIPNILFHDFAVSQSVLSLHNSVIMHMACATHVIGLKYPVLP